MSAQRRMDYDHLRRVLRENPNATYRELAQMMTEHEREVRMDPTYPAIKQGAIGSFLSRERDALAEENIRIPARGKGVRTQPFTNVPEQHMMDTRLRYLRILNRIAAGQAGIPERDRKSATTFADQLREQRQVVDLTPSGKPYVRDARPDELDGEGEIFSYSARHPGMTDREWRARTPAERELIGQRFLKTGFESTLAAQAGG